MGRNTTISAENFSAQIDEFSSDIDAIAAAGPLGAGPDYQDKTDQIEIPAAVNEIDTIEEIGDDVQEIEELTDSMEAALDLVKKIKEHGMSLGVGMEAHKLLPGQFNVPLSELTKAPSQARQKASMESLMGTVRELAVKIVARIDKK